MPPSPGISLFRLYTDRAASVVVFAGGEAERHDAARIGTEHTLLARARCGHSLATKGRARAAPGAPAARRASVPGPADPRRARDRRGRSHRRDLPRRRVPGPGQPRGAAVPRGSSDPASLEPRSAQCGRGGDRNGAEARRQPPEHRASAAGGLQRSRGAARQVLINLGVSNAQTLRAATRGVDVERAEMQRRMHELAATDPSLQRDIAALLTGTAKDSWWLRRKIRKTWPPVADSA